MYCQESSCLRLRFTPAESMSNSGPAEIGDVGHVIGSGSSDSVSIKVSSYISRGMIWCHSFTDSVCIEKHSWSSQVRLKCSILSISKPLGRQENSMWSPFFFDKPVRPEYTRRMSHKSKKNAFAHFYTSVD